jgi:hypothetical protein
MSDQPASSSKVCGSCGADVTSAPRVKDAKGNYFCRECAAKKQAELSKKVNKSAGAPAAGAPLGGDPDIMAKLVADSVTQGANACPACRRPWKEGAVICTGCGFSKQTGHMVGTQIRQAEIVKEKTPKIVGGKGGRRGGKKFAGAHWKVCLAVLIVYAVGFGLMVMDTQEFGPIFMIGTMIYAGIIRIFAAFDAYSEGDSILKAVFVFVCDLYMLYYCALETENDLLKGTAWAYIILILMVVIGAFALGAAVAGMGGLGGMSGGG